MIRLLRPALAAGAAVLLLSGCGEAEVRPGAAALVGEERITADALQQVVERGLSDPTAEQQLGQDLAAFQRQALSRMINREVLEAAAEREGVTVTQGEVDEQLERFAEQAGGREALEAQAAASGVSPQDLPRFVRDVVLEQTLGDELTEDEQVSTEQLRELYEQNLAQYDRVRSRHILVEDEDQARELLAEVREDPSRFDELAAEFSIDESNAQRGGDLGFAGRGQFVPEFEQVLFDSEPGTFEVVQTQFGWHVINVLERDTTTIAEARPELRRVALAQQQQQAVGELLQEVAEDLGVTVNPRFGRWDPETGAVVEVEDPNGVLVPGDDLETIEEVVPGEEQVPQEQAPLIEEAPESEPAS